VCRKLANPWHFYFFCFPPHSPTTGTSSTNDSPKFEALSECLSLLPE